MKSRLKITLYIILLILSILLIVRALMTWATLEVARGDDYFYVKTGWVDEPVLEVR